MFHVKHFDPNSDLENCHREGIEVISVFSGEVGTRLFPVLAGLALMEWKKGFEKGSFSFSDR
jgi:hypothetical protein